VRGAISAASAGPSLPGNEPGDVLLDDLWTAPAGPVR